ncbi:hypothetical protein COHA_007843 [Chlorella ohadii]|uniref:Uncharacterized protein n=1 Tax=Chlorella ohadii TaxID=2649997 RepID=A0AAD5GZF9_9CHLO|nr:hypothetical protein COHA_007843 [Chlorella ohadii]
MVTRLLAAQQAQQSGAETSRQAAERTISVASSPAPGAAGASRQQGRTRSRLQPQPQASEQQGQQDAAVKGQPAYPAEDKQGEELGGRAVSPEPEAEGEEEAAGTSTAEKEQAAGGDGAAAACTSTAGEHRSTGGGGAAAADNSTASEQQAADGGWEDEGPDAAYDPVDAVLAKLGAGRLRPKEFILEVVRGIQEGTLGADFAEDIAAAIPQVLKEPDVCQQQVARHARVLMQLGAPLAALVVDMVDKVEASGKADEAAEAAAVLERAAAALQAGDPAAAHLLPIYAKFTRGLLSHGPEEHMERTMAGLATTLEKCGCPEDADEAHAAAGRLALLADILPSLGQPQQPPSWRTAPLLFVACAFAGAVVRQLGAQCPAAVLNLFEDVFCNMAKWTRADDGLGNQRVARSAAQFCFCVGDAEPDSVEVACVVCSAARIVQAAVDAGLMKQDERVSMLATWVVADVLRVAAQHAEYVRQFQQQPAAELAHAAAQKGPPRQQGPPPLQAPAGVALAVAHQGLQHGEAAAGQGPAAQQAPQQAAATAGEQLQESSEGEPAATLLQLLGADESEQADDCPTAQELLSKLAMAHRGVRERGQQRVDNMAEEYDSIVTRKTGENASSAKPAHTIGVVSPAAFSLNRKALDTAMQQVKAPGRKRNIVVAALVAVRLCHLQRTGKPLVPAGKDLLWIRLPSSRPSAPDYAVPYSSTHNGTSLSVLACHAVQYDKHDGALLFKPALVECAQRAECGEDEGRLSKFAAAHEAAEAAAKAVAAAGVSGLSMTDFGPCKADLAADPVAKRLAQDMVDVWGEGQPLAVAAAQLAPHHSVLDRLLMGATARVPPTDSMAAVQAALLTLAPLGFEAALGVKPSSGDFEWMTFSGKMLRRMAERLPSLDAEMAADEAADEVTWAGWHGV